MWPAAAMQIVRIPYSSTRSPERKKRDINKIRAYPLSNFVEDRTEFRGTGRIDISTLYIGIS